MSIPREFLRSDAFWLGRMSVVVGEAAKTVEVDPKGTRRYLNSALAEVIASPVLCEEVRVSLREYLK